MKAWSAIISICGLFAFWFSSASSLRADWLALDGQNTIWRLADTSGAVIGQFAYLTPYHQEWTAMAAGPTGNVSVVRQSDTAGNGIEIFAPGGTEVGSLTVGPYTNGKLYVPGRLATGPDGNIYIADNYWATISRYNSINGAFMGIFVSNTVVNGLTFGPDGNLYVADANFGIVRYNGTNGAFLDNFAPLGTNGMPDATGLIFGPDKNLYVCSAISNAVFRFDGGTGRFIDDFVPPGSGGLTSPNLPVFGPDGNLYVTSGGGAILRYDGQTGAFLNSFGSHAQLGLIHLSGTNPSPQLTIQSAGNNTVQIRWPSAVGNIWQLCCCQQSMCTTNVWTIETNLPALVGTNYVVTETCTSMASFYRLEKF